jgi:hypothetical protein
VVYILAVIVLKRAVAMTSIGSWVSIHIVMLSTTRVGRLSGLSSHKRRWTDRVSAIGQYQVFYSQPPNGAMTTLTRIENVLTTNDVLETSSGFTKHRALSNPCTVT